MSAYRWEPAPPEWTLSASLVAAEASERLEPDWALLRLSAVGKVNHLNFNIKFQSQHKPMWDQFEGRVTYVWTSPWSDSRSTIPL